MGSYRLTGQAKADIKRIHQWGVRHFGEDRADAYFQKFFMRFEELAENPFLYPAADEIRQGYRKSVCGADTIYYRVTDEGVEVMAIIGHQDFKSSAP